jgi:hypothetical protein
LGHQVRVRSEFLVEFLVVFLYPRLVIERYIEYKKFRKADNALSRGSAARLLSSYLRSSMCWNAVTLPTKLKKSKYFHATDSKLDFVTALLIPMIKSPGVNSWGRHGKIVAVVIFSKFEFAIEQLRPLFMHGAHINVLYSIQLSTSRTSHHRVHVLGPVGHSVQDVH